MSDRATVLYDAPGPKTRRRTLIISVVAAMLLVLTLYQFLYLPMEEHGQFSAEKWGPLLDSGNESMPLVWERLRIGIEATLAAAGWAILCSLVFGMLLAILRLQLTALSRRRYRGLAAPVALGVRGLTSTLNAVTRGFIEIARGLPVLVTIFFVWRQLSFFDTSLWPLVIGLTIYNGVVIAEIIRSGMEGLPKGQREAADAIGLSPLQAIRLIQLPQAVRIMLPALISQMVVILKDTSLGFIITYEETLSITRQIIQVLNNPLQVYLVVAVLFIIVNYSLSKLASYLDRRLSQRVPGSRALRRKALATQNPGLSAA